MSIYVEVKKRFEDFTLDVGFEMGDAALGILGASGSGKSMTLRCIAGIVTPDSGEIVLNGRTLFSSRKGIDLPARDRRVGLLFQSYALFPNMTVVQNISSGVREKARREELCAFYLALLRLEGLEGRYPSQLSGGQQQRVAIARMMASGPDMLMLDEPFSALDRHLRFSIEQEFSRALARFRGTVLYVSHNVGEVYQYCGETLVLSHGRVAERGATPELFCRPTTVEGARLTGCKNITPAKQCGKTVLAKAWSCALPLVSLPEGVTSVGVQDGGLLLFEGGEQGVPVTVTQLRSFPKYDVLHLLPLGASTPLSEAFSREDAARYAALSQQGRLRLGFAPEKLLLLR